MTDMSKQTEAIREAQAIEAIEKPAPGRAHYEDGDVFERIAAMKKQPAQQEPGAGWDSIEAVAAARYKVVPSHDSIFYRHAVVAGNGTQQLYVGRELECENMARKFAGAFLDGAFVMQGQTSPQASKPLTDEQIDRIADQHPAYLGSVYPHGFARAIEAAHGITKEQT